ncbi:MAG: ABC transporter ATP-binding protein [Planctomycetaceae bacterium]|nr:ABC transporter ATP-binding protein [Planctomycetaceae bacterium]
MSGAVLRWEGVSRSFHGTTALDGLTLEVPAGSVFGLLGRNGTGKTTAIRILLGLLRPDAGRSEVLGEDSLTLSRGVRQRIGYLSEESFPYADLEMPSLLRFVSAFFERWDMDRCERLARRMEVRRDVPLKEMSLGERRRAELFLALAQDPEILVLDDPWLGLDAVARRDFLEAALEAAREEGKTLLFTSHVLTDVERIVDRVAILQDGRLRTASALDDLKERTKRVILDLPGGGDGAGIVVPGEVARRREAGSLVIVTEGWSPGLEARLSAGGAEVRVEDLNLEEMFLELTRGPARSGGAAA